uniref:Uncharacterized protein n=1 Tax=Arundo donax TaxID=35708 RepID=A0A0A9HZG1_ARUDO
MELLSGRSAKSQTNAIVVGCNILEVFLYLSIRFHYAHCFVW